MITDVRCEIWSLYQRKPCLFVWAVFYRWHGMAATVLYFFALLTDGWTDGRTDVHSLIVGFHFFSNRKLDTHQPRYTGIPYVYQEWGILKTTHLFDRIRKLSIWCPPEQPCSSVHNFFQPDLHFSGSSFFNCFARSWRIQVLLLC